MIRLIAAIDRKRGISKHDHQPWNIPLDEAYFTNQTSLFGSNILMGNTTFNVIGHPLKNKHNYVLSHNQSPMDGAEIVNDLNQFLANFKHDLWVIGGAQLFELTIAHANQLYITKIDADFNCDLFFPNYEKNFKPVETSIPKHENGYTFTFNIFEK